MDVSDQDPTADRPAAPVSVEEVASFWRLADESRPYLKAVAARVLGGRLAGKVDESDVVQQALMKALVGLPHFRGHTPAEQRAWLVAIVRNQARNLLRYWSQKERDVRREERPAAGSRDRPPLPDRGSTPGERAARRDRAAKLLAALERLPADYRRVIELRQFEGLSHDQVAERMGRTRDVVRQLWVRGVRLLRQRLGDDV